MLPVGLAFYSDEQLEPQWVTINITVDFIFLLDIVVIFRTGITFNKSPERVSFVMYTELCSIALHNLNCLLATL